MATQTGPIILDGTFTDWTAAEALMTPANTVAGYQVYGALINDNTQGGQNYVIGIDATDPSAAAIGPNSIIYLNTDQDKTRGFSTFGGVHTVGAEFELVFGSDSQPYLYSVASDGTLTLQNGGAPLTCAFSSDSTSVELAIPRSLLTPVGGPTPAAIDLDVLLTTETESLSPRPFPAPALRNTLSPMRRQRRRRQRRSPSTEHSRIGKRRPPAAGTVGVIVPAYLTRLQTQRLGRADRSGC